MNDDEDHPEPVPVAMPMEMSKEAVPEEEAVTTRKSFGVTLGGPDEATKPLVASKIDLNHYHNPNDRVFPFYAFGSKVAFVETTTTYDRRRGTSSTHVSGYMPASVAILSCYCDECADCMGCFVNNTVCCCRYQLACKPCASADNSPYNTCECLKTPILGQKTYVGCCCYDARTEVNCFTAGNDIANMPCMCNCFGLTMCYNCNTCKCMCCKSLKFINEN